jgi:ATP-binding cassette, subfamily B, bacterial
MARSRRASSTNPRLASLTTPLRVGGELWAISPRLCGAVAALIAAETLLPNAVIVASSYVIAQVPVAASTGLHGITGTNLAAALGVTAALYVLSLLCGPCRELLAVAVRYRMTAGLQARLMTAVSRPAGIAHLEDPETLTQLDTAQGTLHSWLPADAPITLAGVLSTRLTGTVACLIIGTVRWWAGLGLFVMWLAVRRPLRNAIASQVASHRGQVEAVRRAHAFSGAATRNDTAKEMRLFGLSHWMIEQYRTNALRAFDGTWQLLRDVYPRLLAMSLGVLAIYTVTLVAVGHAAVHHELTLRAFTMVLLLLPATASVGSITHHDIGFEWMASAFPDLRLLEQAVNEQVGESERSVYPATRLPEQSLRFDSLHFQYAKSDKAVLSGVDLDIPIGRSTAIVGLNGAGKTTLVKLLTRLYAPTTGRIAVDGIALSEIEPKSWQKQVAVVFQDYVRYPLSLRENVTFGAIRHADDQRVLEQVGSRAGLTTLVKRLPRGWETSLSADYASGVELSSGQWQRVVLARALFAVEHGARILVLDEPTAWLDVRAEAEFFSKFFELTTGVTSIIISHRFSTVRQADQICVLASGRVAEVGSHRALIAANGQYAEMFRLQAKAFH